jgi:hypothetical protein
MDINIWSPSVLAVIIGFLAVVGAIIFAKNKSTRKTIGIIGGVAGVVGIIVLFMGASLPTSLQFLNDPLWAGLGKSATVGGVQVVYSAVQGTNGNQGSNTGSGYIVTTNPTIAVAGGDKQQAGTSVTPGIQYSNGGGTFATASSTTAVPGQTLDLIMNSSGYHSQVVQALQVTPNSFPLSVLFNKNATITENIYTTTGLVITNGGGAQNQTDLGNGAGYNLKDDMTANALTSTQDMVCIIEITAGTNASTNPVGAQFGGQSPFSTSKPIWYTTAGVNSNVYLFNMPAISDTATRTNNIILTAKSTGRFQATSKMIKNCYTKEWFIDPNTGDLTYDVADSNGAVKSIAQYTYTVVFQ